jgi:Zn-dependent protease with chaperone function
MIIRIFGEGQYELPERAVTRLHELDADTESAVTTGDNNRFHDAYDRLVEHIRTNGTPLNADDLRPSDLLLPPADTTITEAARELEALELIPG